LKKLPTLIAVIGLALAAAVAWWWQRPPGPMQATGPDAPGATRPAPQGRPGMAGAPGAPGARPGGAPPAGGGPAPVEVARAEAIRVADDVQAVGSLRSSQGVMLRPEVSGRVARLGFRDGEAVRRGQLMVQLDDALQQAQLEQAKAQASIARTNLARSRDLLAQNFVSQSAVDQNMASLQVAEAQVALAQAQVARMRVLAPFDGTAGLRRVDIGDYVKDGADLVNVEDLRSLEVEFALPERYVGRVRPGLSMEVAVDALPGQPIKGQVVALDSLVDANGRSLLVRARVANPGMVLKPGMFARPRVLFAVREGAVVVPEEALVPQGARQFVFKVVDGPEGRKVTQRLEAKIGLRTAGRVEILEGLRAGDVVVTAGQARLMRGDSVPVRVIDLSRPPDGAPAGAGRTGPPSGGAPGDAPGGAPGGAAAGAPAGPGPAASGGKPA
jgi:membrane fusion protein (multidrug efflux system)